MEDTSIKWKKGKISHVSGNVDKVETNVSGVEIFVRKRGGSTVTGPTKTSVGKTGSPGYVVEGFINHKAVNTIKPFYQLQTRTLKAAKEEAAKLIHEEVKHRHDINEKVSDSEDKADNVFKDALDDAKDMSTTKPKNLSAIKDAASSYAKRKGAEREIERTHRENYKHAATGNVAGTARTANRRSGRGGHEMRKS